MTKMIKIIVTLRKIKKSNKKYEEQNKYLKERTIIHIYNIVTIKFTIENYN